MPDFKIFTSQISTHGKNTGINHQEHDCERKQGNGETIVFLTKDD